MARKPFTRPFGEHAQRALWALQEAAGRLRACNRYAEARVVQKMADALDPDPIKVAPTVYRTMSG